MAVVQRGVKSIRSENGNTFDIEGANLPASIKKGGVSIVDNDELVAALAAYTPAAGSITNSMIASVAGSKITGSVPNGAISSSAGSDGISGTGDWDLSDTTAVQVQPLGFIASTSENISLSYLAGGATTGTAIVTARRVEF